MVGLRALHSLNVHTQYPLDFSATREAPVSVSAALAAVLAKVAVPTRHEAVGPRPAVAAVAAPGFRWHSGLAEFFQLVENLFGSFDQCVVCLLQLAEATVQFFRPLVELICQINKSTHLE